MCGSKALISPEYPKESIIQVPRNSLQNIPGLVFLPAALRIKLNSIICRGTVMLQSTYRQTIGEAPTCTQYSRM